MAYWVVQGLRDAQIAQILGRAERTMWQRAVLPQKPHEAVVRTGGRVHVVGLGERERAASRGRRAFEDPPIVIWRNRRVEPNEARGEVGIQKLQDLRLLSTYRW